MTRWTKQASRVVGVELSKQGACTVEGECHLSAREQQPWPPRGGVSIFNNSSGTECSPGQRAEGRGESHSQWQWLGQHQKAGDRESAWLGPQAKPSAADWRPCWPPHSSLPSQLWGTPYLLQSRQPVSCFSPKGWGLLGQARVSSPLDLGALRGRGCVSLLKLRPLQPLSL